LVRFGVSSLLVDDGYKQFPIMTYQISEDARRVLYPRTLGEWSVPLISLQDITIIDRAGSATVRVTISSKPQGEHFIYKFIGGPSYHQEDTKALEREMETLEILRGSTNVVQLEANVTSPNPFYTGY
jgi:hypothetical protein